MIATLLENVKITIKAVCILVKSFEQEHAALARQQHTASQSEADGKQQLPRVAVDCADNTSAAGEGMSEQAVSESATCVQ
jgi:hypothetical protein